MEVFWDLLKAFVVGGLICVVGQVAMGAIEAVNSYGSLGALAGGVTRAAAGIAAAIFFGLINALIFKPRAKP